MTLRNKLATAATLAVVGLGVIVTNPNFESRDFKEPHQYALKVKSDKGFKHSGKCYAGGGATFYGSLVGGLYCLLAGGRRED